MLAEEVETTTTEQKERGSSLDLIVGKAALHEEFGGGQRQGSKGKRRKTFSHFARGP